jgi:hypothetical protein
MKFWSCRFHPCSASCTELAMLIVHMLRRMTEIVIRWHRLVELARDPYRPELHYMRGPGPRWYAKHQGIR